MPKVSLVLLTYERPQHLANSLRALQNQLFKDFEVLVCDAGSKANNCELALSFERLNMKVLRHEHKFANGTEDVAHGVHQCAKTANMGLRAAEGQYVMFMQADHLLSSTYLYHLVQILDHMPEPLAGAIVLGYCHYLKRDVGPEFVDWLAEADTFGIPPGADKGNEAWQPYPRYERFMRDGMATLLRCPDWRGIDGFDSALRRDHCLLLDEEFEGQGHEAMDWCYRQTTQMGSTFWCSPLLVHYHQPHQEVRDEKQWQYELAISTALFSRKHGEAAWALAIG